MFKNIVCTLAIIIIPIHLLAQSLNDDLKMKKGEICLALNVSEDKWDQYWEGTFLFHNQNIGTFTRSTISPFVGIGLTNNLNLFAELPYMSTHASGGQMRGVAGIQDFNLGLKYSVIHLQSSSNALKALISANYTRPASNYLSDYLPFSLGLGAQTLSFRTIVFASLKEEKVFIRGNFSYSHVGTTEIE
ncbi:MAG TPA: transporter, partial [Saprospiraceae bacterium]|nr:transporter [Saprospiraceae bacterium]